MRTPEAYGAQGSITTSSMPSRNSWDCWPNQSTTQAPDLPGTNPSSRPGVVVSAFTNEVIQGLDRFHPASSSTHRTDLARVSSMPSTRVGSGSGNQAVAATINALCAVCQDTSCSAATSDTARLERAMARASSARNRVVTRALAGIWCDCWVNVPRTHATSWQTRRRLRQHRSTTWPTTFRSFTAMVGRSLILLVSTPHPGQASSGAATSMTALTRPGSIRSTSRTVNSSSRPRSTAVPSSMLVASSLSVVRDQQHVGATSPITYRAPRSSTKSRLSQVSRAHNCVSPDAQDGRIG